MNKLIIALVVVLAVSVVGFTFATGGKPDRAAPAWLTDRPFAHRGLWSEGSAAPENSRAAFDRAAAKNLGVELDVRPTADGVTVVMHDDDLERMTGAAGLVSERTYDELSSLRLRGGAEAVPTLAEALALIDGRVPVLIEIKNEGDAGALEDDVAEQLLAYGGEVAVQSFNPYSLARMAELAPDVPRGQLSSSFEGEDLAFYKAFMLSNLLMNFTSKPDFIAYKLSDLPSSGTRLQQWRGRPLLGWVAETPAERTAALEFCDGVICNPGALQGE